ncbi:hypothetical protein RFI_25460 [Reticulomyxa filosa]|uniref:Uncharacterized protein n=1 Tax=Reticulomyxa filosa TaxID=46433 RepID=X6ME55_RETFI|nr:hypothetical protein RFI_25460 [Reticulomyxa filosa]|eukprot:ETO11916.1 hypothetical protein RFI_25460 [Reticulomyxa filosa]
MSKYFTKCIFIFHFKMFLSSVFPFINVQAFFHLASSKIISEKTKKVTRMNLNLSIKSKEEETQIIIHHWVRTLNIKLGWIKDFDKLVVNYAYTIFMFDAFCSSAKLINVLTGHTNAVYSIDYSTFDDCQFICSGSYDQTVRVWDVDNNKQIRPFNTYSNYDKTIRFWDFKNNKRLQILNGHTDSVYGIEFSPFNGGRYLCSGSVDNTIRLWDVETSIITCHIMEE